MSVIVTLLIVVLALFWAMISYSRIIGLRKEVVNGWRQIDALSRRRHDLIPNLVSTVKGAVEVDRGTLDAVVAARSYAVGATGPADAAAKEGDLTQALGRFFALAEHDPQLVANDNVRALQEALSAFDSKLASARQVYNDSASRYNTAIQGFPGNVIAGFGNFKPAELFAESTT